MSLDKINYQRLAYEVQYWRWLAVAAMVALGVALAALAICLNIGRF